MKDDEAREQKGGGDHGEVVRMTTQRGLAAPAALGARPFDPDDIFERDADGVAIPRPRKPDASSELPSERAEYVSPRTLPPTEAHKTFEMQTVKVKDEVRFPQKGIPTARNLPRVADDPSITAQVGTPAAARAAHPAHDGAMTPPGPPTAADGVGTFATAAGMYKSPLATTDIPPETDEHGAPINLLASAGPWGAGAQSAAFDPAPGVLVSGSYSKTREPPRVHAPRRAEPGWSRRTKVLLAALAIGAPLTMLLMFAVWPSRNGTESAAAATQSMGPIPTPPATEVAPSAPAEAAAAPAGTTAPAAPPDAPPAAAPAAPASVKSSAPAAPTTNPDLSPKPGATSTPAATKPGAAPQPAKPAAPPTATPASPAATPTTPAIPRPF
ncbi:MAG: hypothetical protein WKG00_27480 [Polyangiaceae bacterium]